MAEEGQQQQQQKQEPMPMLKVSIPRFVPIAQKHGATIYWVTDPRKIRNMLNDPICMEKMTPFEKGWIDQNEVDLQAGQQTTFVEDGRVINTITKSYD
ncbi:putative dimeric alpha-beta barrel protein [Seiridium cardinale]|uniref:Dimeric alpha-beta barrel protein n=1 Tax=Seiridium cardinale TaxID=138064 RepID=A0ABR2XZJ6_9PEZI